MDYQYVTRGKDIKKEILALSLTNILSPLIIPYLIYIGYHYQSFVGLVRGERSPPKWNIKSQLVNGFVPILFTVVAFLINAATIVPFIIIDSPLALLFPLFTIPLTLYLYPLLIMWFEFDINIVEVAFSKNYIIGLISSYLLYTISTGVFVAVGAGIYFIALLGGLAILSSMAIFDSLLLVVVAILVGILGVVLLMLFVAAYCFAIHISLIPLGERMNDQLFHGRTMSYSGETGGSVGSKNKTHDPNTPPHIIK